MRINSCSKSSTIDSLMVRDTKLRKMLNMGVRSYYGHWPVFVFFVTFVMVDFCALFYLLRRDMHIVAKLRIKYTFKAADRFSVIQKCNGLGPIEKGRGSGSDGRST